MYDTGIRRTSATGDSGPGGVKATGLGKQFGDFWAVRDVGLEVPEGTVLGLLGHNGAGKTTTIRMLTTLSSPTTGTATVAGHDVASEAAAVRRSIGVTGQSSSVDDLMSGRLNLELVGRLYGLPKSEARERADGLLERFELSDAGENLARTYSGGMRRRLDLAASLIAEPPVLFLDEPTTGLDPRSRNQLWELLETLTDGGVTVILTTQYLDEADRLADRIMLLDRGRIAAEGTSRELKARYGAERIDISVTAPDELDRAARAIDSFADGDLDRDAEALTVSAPLRENARLIEIVRALDAEGVEATDVTRREATLDDVFLAITGAKHPDEPENDENPQEVAA